MKVQPIYYQTISNKKTNLSASINDVVVNTDKISFTSSSDFIANYAKMLINKTKPVQQHVVKDDKPVAWKNNLRTQFKNNNVSMYAMVVRTFNAKDRDGNELIDETEESGTFRNAVERLDEMKALGINTFHVLPINPPGKMGAKGTAGSVYAPLDLLTIDPMLGTKDDFKYFVNECHKKGISVMVDLPSCASVDLFNNRPDLVAKDEDGLPEIPCGWEDIRMFAPYADKDKKILNKNLIDYHKKFVDLLLECNVDGIRADVARAKPCEFWDEIISYARSKDPEFAFLAETYTYEDASPMLNMQHDRPFDLLAVGFDSYYGQYHILPLRHKAGELLNYVVKNLEMSKYLPAGKSLIASFATHDDKSAMSSGGEIYCNLTTGLGNTLPMTNPYYIAGFESGDTYDYPYSYKKTPDFQPNPKYIALKSYTDKFEYETPEPEKMDIFNLSRKPGGNHPGIGRFITSMSKLREKYNDVITKGSFIPLRDTGDKDDRIISYIRHLNGKTLLIVANRDVNFNVSGKIKIPGLKATQQLNDLAMPYGEQSNFSAEEGALNVNLAPARFHVFEINTPNIEKEVSEVYKQFGM